MSRLIDVANAMFENLPWEKIKDEDKEIFFIFNRYFKEISRKAQLF